MRQADDACAIVYLRTLVELHQVTHRKSNSAPWLRIEAEK